jgi:hypothetical protein
MKLQLWMDILQTSSNLNQYDGYKKLDAATGVTLQLLNFTAANAINVDALYAAIPVEVLDAEDMAIYMGRDYLEKHTTALKNANMFHYNADSTDGEIVLPALLKLSLEWFKCFKRVNC